MLKEFQPLEKLIDKYFNFNLSRRKCLSQFILLMANLRTVNLAMICQGMFSKAKPSSSYKRLIRFLNCELLLQKPLAKLIVAIKGLDEVEKWKLSMDRTNWRFGRKDINILYLSVCYKNVAIPLFFFS